MESQILILSFNNQGIKFYNHYLDNNVHSVVKIDSLFQISNLRLLINQVQTVVVDNYFKEEMEIFCLKTVIEIAHNFKDHEIIMLSYKFSEQIEENINGLHNLNGHSFNGDFIDSIKKLRVSKSAC